jgi:4-amino-4-deoxy-L-arabinose transferase-like glycosyltransferase
MNITFKYLLTGLFFACLTVFVRIPTLFEPAYVDDEHFYLTVGRAMKAGALLYEEVTDITLVRPPLMYVLAAIFDTQFSFRLFTALWLGLGLFGLYLLAKKLFSTRWAVLLSIVLYLFFTSTPILEGNKPFNELLIIPLAIWAWLLVVSGAKDQIRLTTVGIRWFVAGWLMGLAVLIKLHALFDWAAILFVLTYWIFRKKIWKEGSFAVLALLLGFVLPILFCLVVVLSSGVRWTTLVELWNSGFSFITSGYEPLVSLDWIRSWQTKTLILFGWMVSCYLAASKLPLKVFLLTSWLMYAWIASILLNVIGLHYTLQVVPPLVLLVAKILDKHQNMISWLMITICLLVVVTSHGIYPKYYASSQQILAYYGRFADYLVGNLSLVDYQNTFSSYVSRNYEVAAYLDQYTMDNEPIFIWGIYTEIYTLTRTLPSTRYVWHEHVQGKGAYESTIIDLERVKPKWAVTFSETPMEDEAQLFAYLERIFEPKQIIEANGSKAIIYKRKYLP